MWKFIHSRLAGSRRQCLGGLFEDLLRLRACPQSAARVAVWRSIAQDPLEDAARELVWRRFQLPIFEEIHGPSGKLLAWECEAHEGLHIDEKAVADCVDGELVLLRVRTGRKGALLHGRCECGEEVLHFIPVESTLPADTSCDIVADVSR